MKRYIIYFIVVSLIFSTVTPVSYGGWLDTYVDNFKATAPTTFKTATRTSVSLGGVSLRYRPRTDPLFSIEPPRIKAGCGGIDLYMGSFGYLDPEYLLDKMKKIIKTAPAAAFQLALGVLCDPCKNVMNAMEEISQLFNSLQLDECASAKALVAYAATPFVDDPQKKAALQNTITDYKTSTGGERFSQKIREKFATSGKSDNPTETNTKLTDSCSASFKGTYFKTGSLLSNLFEQAKYNTSRYSGEVVEIIRGWIGDVEIAVRNDADGFLYAAIPPCLNQAGDSAYSVEDALLNGKFQKKTSLTSTSCTDVKLSGGKTMQQYVSSVLDSLVNKMTTKPTGSFTSDEKAIILTPGVPVPLLLKYIAYTSDPNLKKSMSEVIGRAIVVEGMIDTIETLKKMISVALELSSKESSKSVGETRCNTQLAADAYQHLQNMYKRADEIEDQIYKVKREKIDVTVKEIMEKIDLARRLEVQIKQKLTQELSAISTKKR